MRNFLLRFQLYIAIFATIIFVIAGSSVLTTKSYSKFRLREKVTTIFLGDSHVEHAINNNIIGPESLNLGRGGECYFYEYIKLRMLIENNPQLETVVIDFSINKLLPYSDRKFFEDKYLSWFLSLYLPFMNREEISIIYKNNPKGFIRYFRISLGRLFIRVLKSDFNFSDEIGGFAYNKEYLDSVPSEIPEYLNEEGIAVNNIRYLEKIVQLCHEKNLDILFIRTPIHSQSPLLKKEELLWRIYHECFEEIEIMDFQGFPLTLHDMKDLTHMNINGANKFTMLLRDLIDKGLLKSKNKSEVIENSIDSLNNQVVTVENY